MSDKSAPWKSVRISAACAVHETGSSPPDRERLLDHGIDLPARVPVAQRGAGHRGGSGDAPCSPWPADARRATCAFRAAPRGGPLLHCAVEVQPQAEVAGTQMRPAKKRRHIETPTVGHRIRPDRASASRGPAGRAQVCCACDIRVRSSKLHNNRDTTSSMTCADLSRLAPCVTSRGFGSGRMHERWGFGRRLPRTGVSAHPPPRLRLCHGTAPGTVAKSLARHGEASGRAARPGGHTPAARSWPECASPDSPPAAGPAAAIPTVLRRYIKAPLLRLRCPPHPWIAHRHPWALSSTRPAIRPHDPPLYPPAQPDASAPGRDAPASAPSTAPLFPARPAAPPPSA